MVDLDHLNGLFCEVKSDCIRYPAVDAEDLQKRFTQLIGTFNSMNLQQLPGGDYIASGLQDLRRNQVTVESCLVKIASPQLVRAGLLAKIDSAIDTELVLYHLLQKRESNPYSAYCAFLRTLCSFEQAILRDQTHQIQSPAA